MIARAWEGLGQAHTDMRLAIPYKILNGEAPLCIPDFVQTARLMHSSRLLLIVFESRPLPFLKKGSAAPRPFRPFLFSNPPPAKKAEWGSGKARGRDARYSARGGVPTRSERTFWVKVTTRSARA